MINQTEKKVITQPNPDTSLKLTKNDTANSSIITTEVAQINHKIPSNIEKNILMAYKTIQNNKTYHLTENFLDKILVEIKTKKNIEEILTKKNIDKLQRITTKNVDKVNFYLAKINLQVLQVPKIFSEHKIGNDLLIQFINYALSLSEHLKNTSIESRYESDLIIFLQQVQTFYHFDEEQTEVISEILNKYTNNEKYRIKAINFNTLTEEVYEKITSFKTLYEQFYFLYLNYDVLLNIINNANLQETKLHENYLELGKMFVILFFNKRFRVFFYSDEENSNLTSIKVFINNELSNDYEYLNDIIFKLGFEEGKDSMLFTLTRLSIAYIDKFKSIMDFNFLYLSFVILRRMFIEFQSLMFNDSLINEQQQRYSSQFENFNLKEIFQKNFEEIVINLLGLEKEMKVVNSEIYNFVMNLVYEEENELVKNYGQSLLELINSKITNHSFRFKNRHYYQEDDDYNNEEKDDEVLDTTVDNSKIENLCIFNYNLKIGFFNSLIIPAGEKCCFKFFFDKKNSLLLITFTLEDNDVGFKIEAKEENQIHTLSDQKLICIDTPQKFILFNQKPTFYEVTFDNSFSWFTSKEIKFKFDVFYKEENFQSFQKASGVILAEHLYQTEINIDNQQSDLFNKVLLFQAQNQNEAFNCGNIYTNLNKLKILRETNKIRIFSIYIDKPRKAFYNEKWEKFSLEEREFTNYLQRFVDEEETINEQGPLNIINIFNLSSFSNEEKSISVNIENLSKVLGFNSNKLKMERFLFFLSELSESCIIYDLYTKNINSKKYQKLFHLNYLKEIGFQLSVYSNQEIQNNLIKEELTKDNIEDSLIKQLTSFTKNDEICLVISSNEEDEEYLKNIKEKLTEKMNNEENKKKYKSLEVEIKEREYIKEIERSNPIFYFKPEY